MKIPASLRRFVTPVAWLSTAALTFCLGRLTSFVEAPVESQTAQARTGGSGNAASSGSAHAGGSVDFTKHLDVSGASLKELTNGQSIEDWLQHLLKQEDEIARMSGFMRLLESLQTSEDLEKALNVVLANSGGRSRGGEYSMLLQKWAQVDPKLAMDFLEKQKDPGAKFGGYRSVLSTWTKNNPQEAIAWAEANGVQQPAEGAEGGNPGQGNQGNWAMAGIVAQLAKTDVSWALRLTESQPFSMARGRMIDSLADQLVSQKGDTAAREAAMGISDENLRASMVARLTGQLARKDPAAAEQWVMSMPAGDTRKKAMSEFIGQLADKDPTAAATFLTKIPPSVESDDSRARLAQNVVRKDPETALAWAGSITDEKMRTSTTGNLVGDWLRRDSDAAKKWVAASPFPAEVQAQLLTAPPQRDRGGPGGFGGGGGPGGGRGRN